MKGEGHKIAVSGSRPLLKEFKLETDFVQDFSCGSIPVYTCVSITLKKGTTFVQ